MKYIFYTYARYDHHVGICAIHGGIFLQCFNKSIAVAPCNEDERVLQVVLKYVIKLRQTSCFGSVIIVSISSPLLGNNPVLLRIYDRHLSETP
jgi:hypothetical protein